MTETPDLYIMEDPESLLFSFLTDIFMTTAITESERAEKQTLSKFISAQCAKTDHHRLCISQKTNQCY